MYVWIASRRIKEGAREEYKKTWEQHWWPRGLLRVYWMVSVDDPNEIIGMSIWESLDAIKEAKSQEVEKERGRAGERFVEKVNSIKVYEAQEFLPPK